MQIHRVRKLPVEVEAVLLSAENVDEVAAWANAQRLEPEPTGDRCWLAITTAEGVAWANPGDWVVRGVEGEFYPCRASVFDASYEVL